ncbi:alpha/beta hydrolase family protein [Paraburkholderia eburnea]|uniref:hypothetical protein n=1 Tax=Paraburkholderia eburnea TaxID=1189126 RepID=UPI0011B09336|nr:hypothetical protein [Paraburkholderia eburnea]
MSTPNPTVPALGFLARKLKKMVLVSHSQSGIYPFQVVSANPGGVAAIVAVEPTACPGENGDPKPYVGISILLLYGDFIAKSPTWSAHYAACKAFAASVNAAGGHVEIVETPRLGMYGNSHMLMQDRNNLQIADVVTSWITHSLR